MFLTSNNHNKLIAYNLIINYYILYYVPTTGQPTGIVHKYQLNHEVFPLIKITVVHES